MLSFPVILMLHHTLSRYTLWKGRIPSPQDARFQRFRVSSLAVSSSGEQILDMTLITPAQQAPIARISFVGKKGSHFIFMKEGSRNASGKLSHAFAMAQFARFQDEKEAAKTSSQMLSLEHLKGLGVMCWKIDVDDWQHDPHMEKIRKDHGYIFWEIITVAPGILENYEQKLRQFFQEHLHPYDESRLILHGSGYWDIRDHNGSWIRFRGKGDMICLPAGMYHRFTVDTHNYIKAVLLYKEVPRRVEVMKPDAEHLEVRKQYIKNVLRPVNALAV